MEQKNNYEDFNLDLKRITVSARANTDITTTDFPTITACTCETSCLISNCLSSNCVSDTCSVCHSYCGSNCGR